MPHRLLWVLRVLVALAAGGTWRRVRRALGRPPRVWHGTYPMHLTHGMVAADRAAGLPSWSVVTHTGLNPRYALVSSATFDIVLADQGYGPYERHWAALCHLLRHADVFVSYFDSLFGPPSEPRKTALAFRLLRWAGLKLALLPTGLDVVHDTGRTTRFDILGRIRQDYPAWDIAADTPARRELIAGLCRQAHLVAALDSYTRRYLPRADLTFMYFPVDTEEFRPPASGDVRPRPLVVHAPNHRTIKGTPELAAAVTALAETAGIPCELRLVEGLPPQEARQVYLQADVIAEQFCLGVMSKFALEGLALGKPVLTYLDQEMLGDPAFNLPVVNTNPENLTRVLGVLLLVPELRTRLGRAGREAVERYQSIPALAEVWGRIHRHLWFGDPLDLEQTRIFSPERRPRSFSEDPAEAEFWPVETQDLQPKIQAALQRVATAGGRP